jgi:hypothetical protein
MKLAVATYRMLDPFIVVCTVPLQQTHSGSLDAIGGVLEPAFQRVRPLVPASGVIDVYLGPGSKARAREVFLNELAQDPFCQAGHFSQDWERALKHVSVVQRHDQPGVVLPVELVQAVPGDLESHAG